MKAQQPEKKIGVLVVDDSPTAVALLREILEQDPEIKVVGTARDGKEAIAQMPKLRPDFVTMDILMPVVDGFEAISYIMAYWPTPILVVTSLPVGEDRDLVFRALRMGALDVIQKPKKSALTRGSPEARSLIRNVKTLSRVKVITHLSGRRATASMEVAELAAKRLQKIVAIGASTGGPVALERVLGSLPANFPAPVVVVQHIADGFTPALAEWLSASCKLRVREAAQEDRLSPGEVLIIPNGCQGKVVQRGLLRLTDDGPVGGHCPSANVLFESAGRVYGEDAVLVVMTGMGSDGSEGARRARILGAKVIAQDEYTSAIFGMPKAAIDKQAVTKVAPLDRIAAEIVAALKPPEGPNRSEEGAGSGAAQGERV